MIKMCHACCFGISVQILIYDEDWGFYLICRGAHSACASTHEHWKLNTAPQI